MKIERACKVMVGVVVILLLTHGNYQSQGRHDKYPALIDNCIKKALAATEDYYIPIKYNNYDKAKVMALEYDVLTDEFSHIVDDCPKERHREKNMLKIAMNVVANRKSALWAYTMYVEAWANNSPNVAREQERATKYINDAEKYRQMFRTMYGF